MRRVKIESMEDMESLPEEVAKRREDRLCATFDGGNIVISESIMVRCDYMKNMNGSCAMVYKE